MGLASLRAALQSDDIHTIAGTVVHPKGESSHFYINEENNVIVFVETHHHGTPVRANLSNTPGVWTVPDIGTEVILASDSGDFEGELYVIGCFGVTNVPNAASPGGLTTQQHNVVVTGDINLIVGSGSVVSARHTGPVQSTIRGETYRNAENARFSAMDTLLSSLAAAFAALAAATPTLTGSPAQIAAFGTAVGAVATALSALTTAITTFSTGSAGYLTTVMKVE